MQNPKCDSIPAALKTASQIATAWGDAAGDITDDVWFRGVNDATYDLSPSAYWRNADEQSSCLTFRQLVRGLVDTQDYDAWDYYSLARHNGIPTRLLDWSEGFVQALFFAFDGWDGRTLPCVWMIRPHKLNELTISYQGITSPPSVGTDLWLPPLSRKIVVDPTGDRWDNEFAMAIFPSRSNQRIRGQLGTFTVHGVDRAALNTYLEAQDDPDQLLARIDLVGFDRDIVRRELYYLGLRESAIYPDPDHLANDIGYAYDWNR